MTELDAQITKHCPVSAWFRPSDLGRDEDGTVPLAPEVALRISRVQFSVYVEFWTLNIHRLILVAANDSGLRQAGRHVAHVNAMRPRCAGVMGAD